MDRRAPVTRVRLSASRSGAVTLRVVGGDRAPAGVTRSGIVSTDIYRTVDGGPPRRIASTKRRTLRLRLTPGRRYAFWSIATDAAGNRERRPSRPDVTFLMRG
jgi:hypothetical protein